ncbi:aminotransferase class III-fold pyridoxal phosphate-dependent enzyme [Photobacterium sp. WH77]|uniref:aminotransferase class III-fold pyridoxal phosphate-dependent enzyme n=1 Tax=unclassified Photobacterium TaxID=2628852 RepID=UPI001EDBA75E|nr:aminotransferase class III-fold pyridoxal phosphate-dependent enzyme [Photobacterium sp. WH77]MCG2846671.1 aminotransferase class III-fold pyridoxal phosphate-dependent enzyme [Photobacterium sp. WH80]
MKFGFIAHPTSVPLKRHAKLMDMFGRMSREQAYGFSPENWQKENVVPFTRFERVVSATGAQCSGIVHYMPLTAEEMLSQPQVMTDRVVEGIHQLQQEGAELVGLGGFTGIVGQRGMQTAKRAKLPVTTGNSLTAYVAYKNVLDALAELEVSEDGAEVAIVGYPGSIALVIARLLLPHGVRLRLVHRHRESSPAHLLAYLPEQYHRQVILTNDLSSCYQNMLFYVAATSSGGVIDPARLLPGSVVVDVALPRDVMEQASPRSDLLLIDGGLISASEEVSFGGVQPEFDPKMFMNGCLAETLILALEGRAEAFSIGRELDSKRVLEIGEIAQRHGFFPTPIASLGRKVTKQHWSAVRQFHHSRNINVGVLAERSELTLNQTRSRFAQYINPEMARFYEHHHLERVFVKGQGAILTDTSGAEYLDFVSGYGCVNVGHNHPSITEAMTNYLVSQQPTFIQYVSMPYQASLLAEQLAALAPGDLSRVFLSNSGTEAVEAAIKLALAASDKSQMLYCENGYHGKTLGALSVTGREKHRKPFEPLLTQCHSVPFGDIAALEVALAKGDIAAFILEPIQGEGGVILPPGGYLEAVRKLCDDYGCLLILDEIQTGLGRTGKMFCCEWDNVCPDILVLSKSLSGGMVPIGATLSASRVWDAAYGSTDRFALHTSTFGGGNLAATAAIATLDIIEKEQLTIRASTTGVMLKQALDDIASEYPFIKAVRGKGLMLGIEFEHSFSGSIAATVEELAHRFMWDAAGTYHQISDKAKQHIDSAVEDIEKSLEDMFVLRVVTKLAKEHQILTFMTANSNRVMRIQPPLNLSESDAMRFIHAFRQVCEDLSTFRN